MIRLEIPYEDTNGGILLLPGGLYLPSVGGRVSGRKTPILLTTNGADSVQEELCHLYGAFGSPQDYAVLTYDRPDQGMALRKDNLHMHYDWEIVVAAVLDSLKDLSRQLLDLVIDLEHIAVAGASMSAYLALSSTVDAK